MKLLSKTRLFAFFPLLGLAALQGCQREQKDTSVLAQVGNATLTLSELRESFPPEFEQLIRREQYLDFIKRWIDDEVIFQQAQKTELDKDTVVARKLAKLRRKLLIEEFLARENASEVFEPDDLAMTQYYEMHKEDFRRKEPEIKFVSLRVPTSNQANDLRKKIIREDFLAVAAANSHDPTPESYASIGFKKQSEFPPCLAKDISSANANAVTLPIACPDGVYLVKVLERQEAGSLIPFAEAKEEISGILIMDRRDKLTEDRIAKYKQGLTIGYNLDQVPGQAEAAKAAEASPVAATVPDTTAAMATASLPQEPQAVPVVRKPPVPKKRKVRPVVVARPDSGATNRSTPVSSQVPAAPAAASKSESEENNHVQNPPANP